MLIRVLVLCATATFAISAPSAVSVAEPHESTPTCGGLTATIVGTAGDDDLTGTDGADVIVSLDGADTVVAGLGADRICGGSGDDSLMGHGGTDHIFGGPGADFIDGGVGGCCDRDANSGDDVLFGGSGDDNMHSADFSAAGNTIHGRTGADDIYLYSGGAAYGEKGRDELSQYAKTATLDGGRGGDTIGNAGDPGAEHVAMSGGPGRDTLGNDDATGTTAMDGNRGLDTCTDGTTMVHCES